MTIRNSEIDLIAEYQIITTDCKKAKKAQGIYSPKHRLNIFQA